MDSLWLPQGDLFIKKHICYKAYFCLSRISTLLAVQNYSICDLITQTKAGPNFFTAFRPVLSHYQYEKRNFFKPTTIKSLQLADRKCHLYFYSLVAWRHLSGPCWILMNFSNGTYSVLEQFIMTSWLCHQLSHGSCCFLSCHRCDNQTGQLEIVINQS